MWPFKKKYQEIIPNGFMLVTHIVRKGEENDYAMENTRYYNSFDEANHIAQTKLKEGASVEIWKLVFHAKND